MAELATFLERIAARQSSFVLFRDRVYGLLDSSNPSSPDYLEADGQRFSLAPSLTFAQWESLDERILASLRESYARDYVRQAIDRELKAEEEVAGEKTRLQTLRFIINEFLPFLVSKKYADDELILASLNGEQDEEGKDSPLQRAKAEIAAQLVQDFGLPGEKENDPAEVMRKELLKREKKNVRHDPLIPKPEKTIARQEEGCEEKQEEGLTPSIAGEITAHQSFYVLYGKLFPLQKFPIKPVKKAQGSEELIFHLQSEAYLPAASIGSQGLTLNLLSAEMKKRREVLWNIAALERSRDAFEEVRGQLKAREVTESHLFALAKLSEYGFDHCGFILREGSYYVYTKIPKFATQDGRNPKIFWPYEATRIAIPVGLERGKPYSSGDPVAVERREFHPCLRNRSSEQGFCGLCNLNRQEGNYQHTLLDLVRKLSDASNVFMQPLNQESLEKHSGESYFGDTLKNILKQGSLTREEALTQGYRVVEVIARTVE